MNGFAVIVLLQCLLLLSAQRFKEEDGIPPGMPKEKVFKHSPNIQIAFGSKRNQKFLEEKVFPVEYFSPPNRNVEEQYYNKKAQQTLDETLLKTKAYTDTDIIMMNRWSGVEANKNLWEADMILTEEQKNLYTIHGQVYGNTARLMSNFSKPWPSGTIQYFYETEGSLELFNNLQVAMKIWESALGCIRFEIPENMKNFSSAAGTTTTSPPINVDEEIRAAMTERTTNATNSSEEALVDSRLLGTSDLLRVTVGEGCYATVGHRPWSRLVISDQCSLGVMVHLLGHVLGLPHEHSRPDRHLYIDLRSENIHTRDFMFLNTESGGDKCTNASRAGWYDHHSVMHLDPYGLSSNNFSTMTARQFAHTSHMGAKWTLPSYNDVLRLQQGDAYGCPVRVPPGCPQASAQTCVGRVDSDCKCIPAAGCDKQTVALRGGCSANVNVGRPHSGSVTGAEQMSPLVSERGRSCAWSLRAAGGDGCGRVRLTLTVRMEEEARVAAAALGCGPLQVETLDRDPRDHNRPLTSVVCLNDFARWVPAEHGGSWFTKKVLVSTSPRFHVLVKVYPVGDSTALGRVVGSLTTRAERAIDKACHCHLKT